MDGGVWPEFGHHTEYLGHHTQVNIQYFNNIDLSVVNLNVQAQSVNTTVASGQIVKLTSVIFEGDIEPQSAVIIRCGGSSSGIRMRQIYHVAQME